MRAAKARSTDATVLDRAAARLAGLAGWRRIAVAVCFGAVSALALPPFNIFPVLFLCFPAASWLLDGCERRTAAFATGWAFGFGNFVAGLYWISNALLVDAAQFAWLLPFVAAGLPAVLALFTGLAFLAVWPARTLGPGRVPAFAVAWTVAEWLRGHLFTGFPWNLIGYTWTGSEAMIQPVSLIGIYGLSLLTVLAAAAPAALGTVTERRQAVRTRWVPLAAGVALLLAGGLYGLTRLPAGPVDTVEGVKLRIVQANIDQRLKWQPEERAEIVRRHLRMSQEGSGEPPDAVIWPETAVPFPVGEDEQLHQALATAIPGGGGLLLTGAPRLERDGTGGPRIWNSLVAVDAAGALVGAFDKFHLVPFGEYVPFRSVLGALGIEKITAGSLDFSAGPGPRTLRLPGLPPVSPLICYEVIFPGAVVPRDDRPAWILNVTNDAWYGFSTGPFQHLAITTVRAVEEGLPLVRAANTGISAVIDPYGRIVARLDLQTSGTIDAGLPRALPPTWYGRLGDLPLVILLLLTTAAAWNWRKPPPERRPR